jgi:hypothetical protein
MAAALIAHHSEEWGLTSTFAKELTAQRLGRMLAGSYSVNSTRMVRGGPRGYTWAALLPVWHRMGVVQDPRRSAPVRPTPPAGTGASGPAGATGAEVNPWQQELAPWGAA